jgi:hypothetical protein
VGNKKLTIVGVGLQAPLRFDLALSGMTRVSLRQVRGQPLGSLNPKGTFEFCLVLSRVAGVAATLAFSDRCFLIVSISQYNICESKN